MKKVLFSLTFTLLTIFANFVKAQTYCTPTATNACTAATGNPTINGFTLNTINKTSNCSGTNYEDFYATDSTILATNTPYNFTVLRGHADYQSPYFVAIWIDLDEDGTFANPGERLANTSPTPACNGNISNPFCFNVTHTGTITVPNGTSAGTKRLRVRLIYSGSPSDPCANVSYGEAEDYKVIITGSVPVTDITVGTITPLTYCAGDAITVPYTTTGTFNGGNTFTAELSDASGNFGSPVSLGTLSSTTSGSINGTIPSNTAFGAGYKIRIISSNPADTSSNNSVSITINDQKPVSVGIGANPSGSICAGSSVTFTATPTNGGSSPSYQWLLNGNNVGTNSDTYTTTTLNDGDSVSVILTSNATCATGSPFQSSTILMSVGSSFTAGTVSAQTNPICAGQQAALSVTGNSGPIQWQSSTDGTNFSDITGETNTTYSPSPSQTTWYKVYGGTGNCTAASNELELVVSPGPPSPMITTADSMICSSDSTQVCVSGGTFASYSWNNGGTGSCTYAKFAGGIWATVTDANGCSVQSGRINITTHSVSSVSIIRSGDTLSSFGAVTYQWIKNGVDVPGATGPVFVATGEGDYAVRITDANGCISTSANVSITGIDEINFDRNMSLFPNPATTGFTLQYKGTTSKDYELSLFNALGQMMKQTAIGFSHHQSVFIPVSDLAKGVYTLQLTSGNERLVRRLIIQ